MSVEPSRPARRRVPRASGSPPGAAARRTELATHDVALDSELRAYLQGRLALVAGFLTAASAALFLVGRVADVASRGFHLENQVHPSVLVHLLVTAVAYAIWRRLRGSPLESAALSLYDAATVLAVAGACVAIYAFSYRTGIRQVVPILALLTVARAIAVPSRAVRTLLLSLPGVLGVLAVQLAHGTVYTLDGARWPDAGFTAYVLWDQAVLLLAVLLATGTSYVLYELRVRLLEAARLGRYTLGARIGGGAIGEVYRARHALIRQPVAVKVLRPEVAGERNLERFEQEVQRTCALTHPNTVRIFDYGLTADGLFYYAMELLDGADLERVVQACGPLAPARVIHVLVQACDALEEAHEQGLVHCDVKPANLVLCRRGGRADVLKVLDFGLARHAHRPDAGEDAGLAFGTPLTMAPEVIRGNPVGASVDLYALGAVGYYLLTGAPPFPGPTVTDVLRQHLTEAPAPPHRRRSDAPEDLGACLLACLAKEPDERFPSVGRLRDALLGCADAGRWTPDDAEAWWGRHGATLAGPAEGRAG